MIEKTFIMVKPDGVQRVLVGEVIKRFEQKGLKLVGLKLMMVSKDLASKHYGVHLGKPFYEDLLEFIMSGPVVAMVWEADNAVYIGRKLVGPTRPNEAEPGTIRGDFCINTQFNVIHASDTVENARKEIAFYFNQEELVRYERSIMHWLGINM